MAEALTASMNRALMAKIPAICPMVAVDASQNCPSMLTKAHAANIPKPALPMEPKTSFAGSGEAGSVLWSERLRASASGHAFRNKTPLASGKSAASAMDAAGGRIRVISVSTAAQTAEAGAWDSVASCGRRA